MIDKKLERIAANSFAAPEQPDYEEECKRLAAENAKLLCIHTSQKEELLMLRTIKATVECIFDRKIDIEKT